MIGHFRLSLLDEIHQKFKPEQQIVLDSNSETTFRKAVKMAMGGSRDDAIIWLCGKLSSEQSLREFRFYYSGPLESATLFKN